LPLYDYQCKACQKVTEVRHGFREAFEGTCPSCGGAEMTRVFSAAPIIFNGSGFYITDSRPSGGESKKSESSAA
jgi:putative FmdB family regulatory protein